MIDAEQAKKIIGRYTQIFDTSMVHPAHALHRAINEVLSEAGPRLNGEQAMLALEAMKAHAWDPVVLMRGINECLGKMQHEEHEAVIVCVHGYALTTKGQILIWGGDGSKFDRDDLQHIVDAVTDYNQSIADLSKARSDLEQWQAKYDKVLLDYQAANGLVTDLRNQLAVRPGPVVIDWPLASTLHDLINKHANCRDGRPTLHALRELFGGDRTSVTVPQGEDSDAEWVAWAKEHLSLKHPERAGAAEVRTALVAALQERGQLRAELGRVQEYWQAKYDRALLDYQTANGSVTTLRASLEQHIEWQRKAESEATKLARELLPLRAGVRRLIDRYNGPGASGLRSDLAALLKPDPTEAAAINPHKVVYHNHTGELLLIPKDADPAAYDCHEGLDQQVNNGVSPERLLRDSQALHALIHHLCGVEHDIVGSVRFAALEAKKILEGT